MYIVIAILVVAIIAVIVVLILAAGKPDIFRIQRSTTSKASPDQFFPFINDFHNWSVWSPFEKLDPVMKKNFSGAAGGKGAVYEWEGNSKAGKGRMEIVESSPPGKVAIKLDFIKPFEGHNITEFTMTPKGDSTEIVWAMHGPCSFGMKIFHVFCNMDKMIGKDFEAGLANLKVVAEK
jgi:hypothetical protein